MYFTTNPHTSLKKIPLADIYNLTSPSDVVSRQGCLPSRSSFVEVIFQSDVQCAGRECETKLMLTYTKWPTQETKAIFSYIWVQFGLHAGLKISS